MILTGKASEDFLEWIESHGWVEDITIEPNKLGSYTLLAINRQTIRSRELTCFIIEWLDSGGIYVNIGCIAIDGIPEYDYCIQENNTLNGMNGHTFESRQQATEAAIKLANQIYNNKA